MNSTVYKCLELFIIFILVPVSFAINYSPWIKLGIGFLGFSYVIYILLNIENLKFKVSKDIKWKPFWKSTIVKLVLIAIITTVFVWITDSGSLFSVLLNQPIKWLMLLFVYSFFSVYPQELIFRTFFFKRYQSLFKSDAIFIFVNAILFALAHLFFGSVLVIILTF